ncbi:MAG: filamentous hemagglutinin N-terminal domain-containing protein [Sedimentisphaerales bacterium]
MDFKSQTKKVLSRQISVFLAISCLIFNSHIRAALAGPKGAQVINGQVGFQQSGCNTTITASDKAIINYSSFDIAQPETVRFVQPSSNASVLNRILSANPTNINGTLLANGRVFFVNPAGVYIGNGARINVAQLVASSLNISNSDFINGQYNFAGGTGSVINSGDITAEKVYLIGKQVANYGNISCPAGYVVMASGDRVFLGEVGSDVVVEIDVPSLPEPVGVGPIEGCGVLNEGTVEVGNGTIVLAAAGDIYSQAISNVGTLSASSDIGDAGHVKLIATDGTVINSGSIEAKSSFGTGGTVQMLGDKVGLFGAGQIDVSGSNGGGTVLVGGDYKGRGDVPTASRTYVSSDSTIKADAVENGDGGKVIVWADETTRFYGDVSARGGAKGGNGGFVEISGKNNLGFYGYVDTFAPKGNIGTLLMDPTDLSIINGAGPGSLDGSLPDVLFAEGGLAETVAETALEALNSNIILQATHDIILNNLSDDNLNLSKLDTESLVMQAGNNITFSAGSGDKITTAGGAIHLEADSPHSAVGGGDGTGTLTLGSLTSNGGDITLIGADFILKNNINAGNGNITIGPSTNTALILGSSGQLTNTEINRFISNGILNIGEVTTKGTDGAGTGAVTRTASSITVASSTTPANVSTLHLKSGGTVTGSSALSNSNIAIEAAGDVMMTSSSNNANTLAIYTSTGNVQWDNVGSFSVGTVDGVAGVSTDNGTLKLTARTGNLTVKDTAAAHDVKATGELTLQCYADEGKLTIEAGADVGSTGGTNYYKADKMDIAGTITATGQRVTIRDEYGGDTDPVDLGSTVDTTANTLELSNTELNHITAAELRFGDFDTEPPITPKAGAITISADISPANITDTLRLNSDSTVTINGKIDTQTAGHGCAVIITNTGLLKIAPGADMTLDGAFTQNGAGAVQTAGDITTTGDAINFLSAVTLTDSHSVALSTGAGAGDITFQNTLNGTTDFAEGLSLTAGTGNIDFDGIVGGTKALGNVTINSADDVQIQAAFNANNMVITDSDTTINIDDDVTAAADIELSNNTDVADGVTLTAGNDLKLAAGKTVTGEGDLTLVAIAGGITEKAGDDGKFQINMAADNKTLTLTQNDALDTADFLVTNDEDTYLVAASTGGTIISTAAGAWESITANASGNLTLTNLNNNDTITIGNLTSGGEIWVQSIADLTAPAGVTITANGAYSDAADDRAGVKFANNGDPIDVAIYLGSYDFTTQTGGNVTVNSAVSMTNNGTMVIDAYDTVNTFGSGFTSSAPWSNATNRLEVVSRISQSLDDVVGNHRLPYAKEASGNVCPSWFGSKKYVLRGKKPLAEVFIAVGADSIPTVPPIAFSLGSRDKVTWPDIDSDIDMGALLQWLAEELGEETIQVYWEDAYLYSTDLQPYEVAARLMNLTAILKDTNPRLSALAAVVGEFIKKPPPSEEQMASLKSALLQHRGDGTNYDKAGEWLDALATYVSILNTGLGWSSERSIGFVMSKYGSELDRMSAVSIERYLRDHLAANNEQYSK